MKELVDVCFLQETKLKFEANEDVFSMWGVEGSSVLTKGKWEDHMGSLSCGNQVCSFLFLALQVKALWV